MFLSANWLSVDKYNMSHCISARVCSLQNLCTDEFLNIYILVLVLYSCRVYCKKDRFRACTSKATGFNALWQIPPPPPPTRTPSAQLCLASSFHVWLLTAVLLTENAPSGLFCWIVYTANLNVQMCLGLFCMPKAEINGWGNQQGQQRAILNTDNLQVTRLEKT